MNMFLISVIIYLGLIACGLDMVANAAGSTKNEKTITNIYKGLSANDMNPLMKALATKYTWKTQSAAEFHPFVGSFDNDANGYFNAFPFKVQSLSLENIGSSNNQVYATIKAKLVAEITKKEIETIMTQIWTFDSKGKITAFLQFIDTAALADLLIIGHTAYDLIRFETQNMKNFNSVNVETAYSLYSPDVAISRNGHSGLNIDDAKMSANITFQSFPDYGYTIQKIVASGNSVVTVRKITGTFNGKPYEGIPPNGKKFAFYETTIDVVKDGKIIEKIDNFDISPFIDVFK